MRARGLLKDGADWIAVLEGLYEPTAAEEWGRTFLDAISRVIQGAEHVSLYALRHDADWSSGQFTFACGPGTESLPPLEPILQQLGHDDVRATYYPPQMVATHSEIERTATRRVREITRSVRSSLGVADLLGVIGHPDKDSVLILTVALPSPRTLSRYERHRLSQLGLHLSSAHRLRHRPETLKAEIFLNGDDQGPWVRRARAVDSKRSAETAEEFLDVWTALIGGRYTLAPRHVGGRRRYLVLENGGEAHGMHALTTRQVDVLSMVAKGLSNKLVAYALGLSTSSVSEALRSAASRLGLSTRLELVRLAAMLAGDPRESASAATLTAAEREILDLLREGLSNLEIARIRSRSARTIANQVASLLRKTQHGSRRALASVTR